MLQSLLLDSTAGSRTVCGSSAGAALTHLLRVVLQQPYRTASAIAGGAPLRPPQDEAFPNAAKPCCSTSGCNHDDRASGASSSSGPVSPESGFSWGGLRRQLPLLLLHQQHRQQTQLKQQQWLPGTQQQMCISTSQNASYNFDSHLTRYNKSRVANRDTFQRFRDSGRDARVATDILREGERGREEGRRGAGLSGRRPRGPEEDAALLELRSMVHDCRDLRAMQVLVRECVGDLDAFLVCNILGRLPQLKQDTPAAVGPDVLARRVAETLMIRLEALANTARASGLAFALLGLVNSTATLRPSMLAAIAARLAAPPSAADSAATLVSSADPRIVSKLIFATAKMLDMHRHQQQQGETGSAAGGITADEILRTRLWPVLRDAAEVKLLRALGEEPPGSERPAAAAAARRRGGGDEEVQEDDSMPQTALRFICIALALARETHAGTWSAAARLTARHAGELQPAAAASVLRSYATAGGPTLDGGAAMLPEAIWAALGPQMEGLELQAQLDMLIAALKLRPAVAGPAAAAMDEAIAALCGPVASRLPALGANEATHLVVALAELHSRTVAEAAAAAVAAAAPQPAWRQHAYGVLPRLLANLLVLRGVAGFGASKFASAALALGLLGHVDDGFWQQVAAAALPEVPRMDGRSLSRLLGALHSAALAAAAAASGAAAVDVPVAPPPPALLAAALSRIEALLEGGAEGLYGKTLFYTVRSLAEWTPSPSTGAEEGDGGATTLTRLVDRLMADEAAEAEVEAAPLAVRARLGAALRRAGLGEHAFVGRLVGDGK